MKKSFTIHTIESAPEASKPLLEASKKSMGMIPNLLAELAESPETFEAYQRLHELFTKTSFSAEELTVVWQSINVENECGYCVPAHSAIAGMMRVDPALNEALRNEEPLPSEKLEVLRGTTLKLVKNRGHLTAEDFEKFYSVGYQNKQLLEIILGISQKTISNYVNHIAKTPLDAPFQKFTWERN